MGLPATRVEPVLALEELAADLHEIAGLHRIAGFEIRVVAPDAQGHAIDRIGERELAVGLLVARGSRGERFDLDMDARLERTARHCLANFLQSEQFKHGIKFAFPRRRSERARYPAESL